MRKIAIWSCAVILLAVGGLLFARANVRGANGCFGHRWGRFGPAAYVAHELSLTHAQKQQIHLMWQAERPAVSGLLHELAAESKEMDQATAKGNLDKSKVQEIATRQGATLAKLLVEKEQFQTKVYAAILNPEQQTKADALLARWHDHLDHISRRME